MSLVFERFIGESIMIGEDIQIVLTAIKGPKKVKIAVNAPRGIPVHRREIYERLKAKGLPLDRYPD